MSQVFWRVILERRGGLRTEQLTPRDAHAPQRRHNLREVINALRWLARAAAPLQLLPQDLPPQQMVYQQFRRWDESGCFEAMVGARCKAVAKAGCVRARRLQETPQQQGAHGRGHAGAVDCDNAHPDQ